MEYLIIIGLLIIIYCISSVVIHRLQFIKNRQEIFAKNPTYKNKVMYKVDNDLKSGEQRKAIRRLTGALECKPLDEELTNKLSDLLLQNSEFIRAGQIIYLKENKTEREVYAVNLFEKSVGNDPTLILKKLLNKNFFRLRELNKAQLKLLSILLKLTKEKENTTPKFLRDLDTFIEKNYS